MADERLLDFPAKTTPTPSDLVFAADASNLFSEVKVTIQDLVGAYPNLLDYGSLSLPNNSYVYKDGTGTLTTGTITTFGASILADANSTDLIATLGLGDAAFANLPIAANQGGTGTTSPTDHGIAIAQGSDPYNFAILGDGEILIGRAGFDPIPATITAGTNITINNTAGGIEINATGGGGGTGTVESITAGTGLTGGTITTTGTIDLDIPVIVANGGTGVTSATQHGIAIGQGTSPLGFQTLDDGEFLVGSTGNTPVPTTLVAGTNITLTPGAGTITIDASGGGGGITYNVVAGTSQAMAVNQGYITTNASLTTLTLPATAAQGARVEIVGSGSGGWRLAQNASQTIHFNSVDTTTGTGGRIDSSNRYNSIALICTTANTDWVVVASSGALTTV